MKAEAVMDIALANDENYFIGLWATLMSLLAAVPDASRLRINIIDTGISDASWNRLANAVGKHPAPPTLVRKVFPRERLEGLEIPGSRSPLVYARLFLPELLNCERVLYLDSDMLVFKNVLDLESVDLTGHACAAVINEDAGTLDFDLSEEEYLSLNLDPKSNYFNAGLIFMNLDYWREHDFTGKCLDFLKHHKFRLADQSALNAVMNEKILPLARHWNRLAVHLSPDEVVSPGAVIHYTSTKPWIIDAKSPVMLLWRKFAEDTGLELNPPTQKISVWERNIFLNVVRTAGYGFFALWYALRRHTKASAGYTYAFSYWAENAANRRTRQHQSEFAALMIDNKHYGPSWLSGSSEASASTRSSISQLKHTHIPVKGKRMTNLLRDRGRTRELVSSKIQRRQASRLEAILTGKKKPRISDLQSEVPVSLTSWPPRRGTLPLVLLSIIEQNLRPSAVHVWLSPEDQEMIAPRHKIFFQKYGVEFHTTEDIVPHKKWLPLIESGYEKRFAIIDDDTYYPRDWFLSLVTESIQFPDNIVAHRCHKIRLGADQLPQPYAEWDKDVDHENEASHYLFPTGCGGIMVDPRAISTEFRDRDLIQKLSPLADDVWLKAAYIQSGFKCRKSHYYFPCLDYPGTRESGLAVRNVDQGQNDQQLKAVFDYFDLRLD